MNKNNYPFRLGCTSYVYPDEIVPNVKKMAPIVDDIEIVLFQSEEYSNLPDTETISELAHLSKENNITYTVHFPIDKDAGATDAFERKQFSDQVKRIIELMQPVDPYGYLLHFQGIEADSSEQERNAWLHACDEVCRQIAGIPDLEKKKICVENLSYPLAWHMDMVERYGFSLCLDIGHLLLSEKNWDDIFAEYLGKTRIIHLHGVCDMKDHISLKKGKLGDVEKSILLIKESKYRHIVTLEVFDSDDTFESIEIVEGLWQNLH